MDALQERLTTIKTHTADASWTENFKRYRAYLDALENTLLKLLPSIGTYSGAWTSGVLKRNMAG